MKIIYLGLVIVLICCGVMANAYEFSGIDITNVVVVEDFHSNHYNAIHTSWDVSDGLDGKDYVIDIGNFPNGFCYCVPDAPEHFCEVASMYSDVNGNKLLEDYRPCDSNAPFDIKLFLCGSVGNGTENYLLVDFYGAWPEPECETFDDKIIILESDRLPHGQAYVDVRKVIKKGSIYGTGLIELIPLTGDYNINNPYGNATLYIVEKGSAAATAFLCDINIDGVVNLEDYACIAESYEKFGEGLAGDITGPNGVPDGCVDYADISAFAKEYLWE